MNVKKQIKKVAAVGASLAIAATTMVSALAYDLSDYPAPFVEDGVFNGAIVVGAEAATQDVLGAIDIAASLQAESKTGSAVSGGSGVTVTGGEDFDEIFLDATPAYDSQLDDSDLEGFLDTDFDFNDEDYDYEEYIVMSSGAIRFPSSDDGEYDEDFGRDIYGTIATPSDISYVVEIEADFNPFEVNNQTSDDDDIEIKFLGKTLKITDFDATSMTVEASNEFYLEEGDSVTVDGHEVELRKVGENAVLVAVDGQTLSIGDGETEEFDQADDFEVEVESFFYIEGADDNSATLTLGSSISDTVDTGDSAEVFGEPSDEDEADWLWDIDASDAGVTTVAIDLNIERTDLDADEDDERNALAVGESIDFPNNYASIVIEEVSETSFTEITVEIDNDWDLSEDDGNSINNAWGYKFSTDSGSDDFNVSGADTSEVWAILNGTALQIWYEDGSDEVQAGNNFAIELDSDSHVVTFTNATGGSGIYQGSPVIMNATITLAETSEVIQLWGAATNDFYGTTDEEQSADLSIDGAGAGSADYDGDFYLLEYGGFFEEGESQFNSGNTFEFSLPDERQEVTVVVKSEGSVVSAGSSSGMSYSVNPIGLGLGILDSDAPALGSKPMIVVGGPYANTVAAELLGNPTPEQISETFTDGRAGIWWFDEQQAMLVAGWSAQDTLGAAYVVAKYDQYDFAGDEIEVIVTSLDNIRVNNVG